MADIIQAPRYDLSLHEIDLSPLALHRRIVHVEGELRWFVTEGVGHHHAALLTHGDDRRLVQYSEKHFKSKFR